MKNYILFILFLVFAMPVMAQTSTTNTTTTTNTGTTNATVSSPGNVVVSTPNGTIGNQVNTPANTNNVYVVTPGANTSNFTGSHYAQFNQQTDEQRDELQQRRFEEAYDRDQSQHDYRDRANYYNINRNEAIESGSGVNAVTRQNIQADYHSNYNSVSHSH
jgi:hypothetical protein